MKSNKSLFYVETKEMDSNIRKKIPNMFRLFSGHYVFYRISKNNDNTFVYVCIPQTFLSILTKFDA